MKPAWDQLGDEFADSTSVVIGDVDCTVEEELCGKYGVEGYPTIKYFTGATDPLGDSYDGGREYDDLKALAILAESDDSKMQLKAMTLINRCRLTVALSKFSVQYSAAMGVKNDGQVTAVKRRRTNIDGDDGQCARKLASGIQYRSSSGTLVLLVRQDYFSSDFSHRNRVLIGSVGCR